MSTDLTPTSSSLADAGPSPAPPVLGDQKTDWACRAAVFFGVFLPFALGQYMHAFLRNVNAVLVPNLVDAFALDAGQLGLLTSTFFFSVVVSQLPVSAALERYGPHRVQLTLLLFAALGAVLFACGQTFMQLVVARAIMGFGVGGTLMTAVKAVSAKVSRERLPSSVGFLIAFGGLGSASATMPVRPVLEYTDWRGLFLILAALTAAIALFAWLVRPPEAPKGPSRKPQPRWQALLEVCRTPGFRQPVRLVLVSHTIYWGVQGLWIGRWLSDVAGFSEAVVDYLLYLSMAAVIFGAIAVGMITEWAGRRGIMPLDVAAIGVSAFVLVQFVMVLNYAPSFPLLAVLFTLVGTITGIEYTIVQQNMSRESSGAASCCLNMLIFLGAFLVQAAFGQIIDLWPTDARGRYPSIAYQVAFGAMVLLQLPGLIHYYIGQRRLAKRAVQVCVANQEAFQGSPAEASR